MEHKKVVYISGPITGVPNYWEAFEHAEDDLTVLGYIPLSPARLPQGMTNEQYMRIDIAMLHSADAVLFLPGYAYSRGAQIELLYSTYLGKPHTYYPMELTLADRRPYATLDELREKLKEVLGE